MKIGHIIKRIRKEKKMTLQELSDQSGVSLATLSRIENERMTGTIDSHQRICKALDIGLPELYSELEESKATVDMQARTARSEVFVHSKKSSSEILTSEVLSKKMMPILIGIEKGGSTHKEENKRGIEKFVFVLEGKVEARVGKERYHLNRADTLYFEASLPHVFKNIGGADAKIMCVISPPAL